MRPMFNTAAENRTLVMHGARGCMGSGGAWGQGVHGVRGCMGSGGAWDQGLHGVMHLLIQILP